MTVLWTTAIFNDYFAVFFLKHCPGDLNTNQLIATSGNFLAYLIVPFIMPRLISGRSMNVFSFTA